MSKVKDQWDKYRSTIPGLDKLINSKPVLQDGDEEYQAVLEDLPSSVVDCLPVPGSKPNEESDFTDIDHHWCLCEMPEGDFPRVYAFSSLPRLVEAIAKRDGQETAVWAMYGIPLRVTKPVFSKGSKGKVRYLLLPNQLAVQVSTEADCDFIDQSLLPDNVETQDEGWLGDPGYLKEQSYFVEGIVEDDQFSADPDMDDEEEEIE